MARCEFCRDKFESKQFNRKFCYKTECEKLGVEKLLEKVRKQNEIKYKKQQAQHKKQHRIEKNNIKTRSELLKELEKAFNSYIRERDKNEPCISCRTTNNVQFHAGHYFPAGNYSALRFDENNVHKQCGNNCNKNKHGNIHEYRIWLIKKIGQEAFNELENKRHDKLELSREQIIVLTIHYKEKLKTLKNI